MYDFRKIGEQNRYGMKRLDGSAELKVSRFLGRHYTVSLARRRRLYDARGDLQGPRLPDPQRVADPLPRNRSRYSGEKFDVELHGCWSHRTVPESRYESESTWKKHGIPACVHDLCLLCPYGGAVYGGTDRGKAFPVRNVRSAGADALRTGQPYSGGRLRSFPLRAGRTIDVAAYDQPDAGPARLGLVPGVAVHRF